MWNFPKKKQRNFQNILGIRKKLKEFPKNTQGFEKKPYSFGGNVPQVASQKSCRNTIQNCKISI